MSDAAGGARAALHARICSLIDRLADGSQDDDARDRLLRDLADYQAERIAPYGRLRAARCDAGAGKDPALPTDVFRFARVSSRPATEDLRVFESSGTTDDARSRHAFADLSLYDRAARAAARYALFPDHERMPLVLLAPRSEEQRGSSLSYMLQRFCEWFGEGDASYVWQDDRLDVAALRSRLQRAEHTGQPVALLGTSFAFVHALDALERDDFRVRLPTGSRLMQTGGFKGRSREVSAEALRSALASCLGLAESHMVTEYGMTELSSQLYESSLREVLLGEPEVARRLWAPGWVRVSLLDADGLHEVAPGEPGLVRIDDCANLDSVSAIQTADLGRRVADDPRSLEILGRASGAEARGCSLAADAALNGKSGVSGPGGARRAGP